MHSRLVVILDTNVFISAIVYKGLPGKIIELYVLKNEFEIAISPEILAEILGKLKYKFCFSEEILKELRQEFEETFKYVLPVYTTKICRDPDDNKVIDLALCTGAKYIITGDKNLLILKSYKKIQILKPSDFLEIIENKK